MSFTRKRILTRTFLEPHFEVMQVYEFQTKVNSYEDLCWVSLWRYLSLWISNKRVFLSRYPLSLSLKLSKLTSFKKTRIHIKTFVESQFEVMEVYYFQTKSDSYEDISWTSVWDYVSLWVENKSHFLRRHILGLSLKLRKFMSFKPKPSLLKTFVESQFQVM